MEITNNESGEKTFQEIVWGKCFIHGEVVYLRVKGTGQGVRLSDGEIIDFNEDCLVQPVEAKVVVI